MGPQAPSGSEDPGMEKFLQKAISFHPLGLFYISP